MYFMSSLKWKQHYMVWRLRISMDSINNGDVSVLLFLIIQVYDIYLGYILSKFSILLWDQ